MHCGKKRVRDHVVGVRGEMLRIGYLDEAVAAELVDARVEELAHVIASNAPIALRGMKRTFNEIARNKFDHRRPASARTCTATKCGKVTPPLQRSGRRGLKRGPPFPDRSSLPRANGTGIESGWRKGLSGVASTISRMYRSCSLDKFLGIGPGLHEVVKRTTTSTGA